MSSHQRTPVTAEELEATRLRLLALAEDVARTEDRIADTFERIAQTRGDPDGHRRRIADEARRYAQVERRRASGADLTRQDA